MTTVLQRGAGNMGLGLGDYDLQTAFAEERALLDRLLTAPQGSSVSDTRLDIYWSGGDHLVLLGSGFTEGNRYATVTSFNYSDPVGTEIEFIGNLTIDLYWGEFTGGSLTSFFLKTPNLSLDLEGSMNLDSLYSVDGHISLLSMEVLGVGMTLNGDLYVADDGSFGGQITQIRFDWGDGQYTEFHDVNISCADLGEYATCQDLFAAITAGNAAFYGSPVDDTFSFGDGNNTISGDDGADTVVMGGIVSQYHIGQGDVCTYSTGPEGTDTLDSIEYIRFGSSGYTTDVPLWDATTENPLHLAQQIADLYVAYFNRGPDAEGFDYWFHEVYTGAKTLRSIAEDFSWSHEYQSTYPGSLTDREFVEKIYLNLFDRSPDDGGWDYWSGRLDEGSVCRSGFILDVIEGAYAPSSGPEDRTLIDNKHDVSLYYTGQLAMQPQEGFDFAIVDLLDRVTGDADTVLSAEGVIDYAFDNPITLTGVMADEALFDSLWLTAS